MAAWTIFDYLEEADGPNVIRSWIDGLPVKAQVKIDMRIRYLEATNIWAPQYISALTGCDGILELRIVSDGVQYRPLGYYGPSRREFTLLIGAIEKGSRLEPRSACEVAQRRKVIVNGDRIHIVPHQFG